MTPVSLGVMLDMEFYMANTDKWSDTHREMLQCGNAKDKRAWKAACSIKLVDRK